MLTTRLKLGIDGFAQLTYSISTNESAMPTVDIEQLRSFLKQQDGSFASHAAEPPRKSGGPRSEVTREIEDGIKAL